MKKNDDTMLNRFIGFYKKLNERCNKVLNEILDEKPQGKPSLLDKFRAKCAKHKAKDRE